MVIVFISVALIAFIVCSVISDYSIEARRETIENTAKTAIDSVNTYMKLLGCDFDTLLRDHGYNLTEALGNQADLTDTVIFITDTDGNILISAGRDKDSILTSVPSDVMAQAEQGTKLHIYSTLGGVFKENHLTSIYPIKKTFQDGTSASSGAFFISSLTVSDASLTWRIYSATLFGTAWLLILVLMATYILSSRISKPIKEMSVAAKSFAQGKFGTRLPVKGKDEMAELATALNDMATALEKNEEMRRTFIANVSHDLRTPMTSISGFIDGILSGLIPQDKHQYYLTIVQSEVSRLSRLVSSLLDISKIQAGERKFNMMPFDICELARQILISLEKSIDEKHIDIEFDCDRDKINVLADKDAIYQVVYNLCDNAVKFTDVSGKIDIKISIKDKKVFFSVYNTGQGITEEDLPFVFDRFYKSDRSRGLDKGGVGLGLSIVKTIIDSHGEDIWVKSEYGSFCEFVFTLSASR